jgi:prevent-host-death family protein
MSTIEALEAKNSFDSMLDRVEAGEEILITRDGKPAVRMTSAAIPAFDRQAAREAAERIREQAKQMNLGPFDWEEWKKYRDEGKK